MFHFFACLRLRFSSKVFTTKFVPIAILSLAIFLVIAVIACTAAKAFEEQTWTAFGILLVVSIQVLGTSQIPPCRDMTWFWMLVNNCASPALEESVPCLLVLVRWGCLFKYNPLHQIIHSYTWGTIGKDFAQSSVNSRKCFSPHGHGQLS